MENKKKFEMTELEILSAAYELCVARFAKRRELLQENPYNKIIKEFVCEDLERCEYLEIKIKKLEKKER